MHGILPALAYIPSAKILPQTQKKVKKNLLFNSCLQPRFETANRPSVFAPLAPKRHTGVKRPLTSFPGYSICCLRAGSRQLC